MSDFKEKTKDILAGFASASTIALGISTVNPVIALTGALTFFSNILNPTIRGRSAMYLESLHNEILELQKSRDEFYPKNLQNNQFFATAVLKTTEIALKTHQIEKMELLKNSVINSVLMNSLEDDLQQVFINSLETITPTHVIALQDFSKIKIKKENEAQFQKLSIQYEDFLSDLDSLGYLKYHDNTTNALLLEEATYYPQYRITEKGKKFLTFITKPN